MATESGLWSGFFAILLDEKRLQYFLPRPIQDTGRWRRASNKKCFLTHLLYVITSVPSA